MKPLRRWVERGVYYEGYRHDNSEPTITYERRLRPDDCPLCHGLGGVYPNDTAVSVKCWRCGGTGKRP